jgi:hypothetical protein
VNVFQKTGSKNDSDASQRISDYIAGLNDWRGDMLARVRELVHEAAPGIAEEWKWDTPVWSQKGNVLAGGIFRDYVKLNFFKGAFLQDPKNLFNAGLNAKTSRAIDLYEGDEMDEAALKDLIRAAVARNTPDKKK